MHAHYNCILKQVHVVLQVCNVLVGEFTTRRMIITGWRRALNSSDLWSLNPNDRSGTVAPKLGKNWQHQLDKTK